MRAIELRPEDRETYLRAACQGDDEKRQRVMELLAGDKPGTSFLDRPCAEFGTIVSILREMSRQLPGERATETPADAGAKVRDAGKTGDSP